MTVIENQTDLRAARSLRALAASLIDYAGLFPPAGLAMNRAAENYGRYAGGVDAWALGRFIAPVVRLGELEAALGPIPHQTWHLSALSGDKIDDDVKTIREFNHRHQGTILIDVIEVKAAIAGEVDRIADAAAGEMTTYVEIPVDRDPSALVAAIGRNRLRAKIRTGGVVESAFPPSSDVIRLLRSCEAHEVAFKATAGLHHPIRCSRPFTYEPDSRVGVMHGFLNLFLLASMIPLGISDDDALGVLTEQDASAFHFGDVSARWRSTEVATESITDARSRFAIAFGSCSFEEPVEELRALGWIGADVSFVKSSGQEREG